MENQNVFHDSRYQTTFFTIIFFSLITLGLFLYGANTQVAFLSNYLTTLVSLVHMVIVILFWRYAKDHELTKKTFQHFTVGFVLWAMAEVIWLVYILLEQDPYPSLADLLWLIGYVFLSAALYIGYKALGVRPAPQDLGIIYTIILIVLSLTGIYIFIPILQDYTPGLFLVSLLNMAYPILDLVIISQVLFLFFILEKSRFKIPWLVLAVGFTLMAITDLGFSFADWNGIYDAEQGNLISRLVDWGYLINYPILSLGVYAYFLVFKQFNINTPQVDETPSSTQPFTNTDTVYIINKDNLVIDLSDNFLTLMETDDKKQYINRPIGEVLGQTPEVTDSILQKIANQGFAKNVPLTLKSTHNKILPGFLSALVIKTSTSDYGGASIVIRTHLKGAIPNKGLSEYHQSLALNVFRKVSVPVKDFSQALHGYLVSKLEILLKLISEYSGEIVAESVSAHLNTLIPKNSEQIKISLQEIWLDEKLSVENMLADFSPILSAAQKEATRLLSQNIVEEKLNSFNAQMDPFTLALIDDYELR